MRNWLSVRTAVLVSLLFGGVPASAEQLNDVVLQKLAALEARIATLETKNREYRLEAELAQLRERQAVEKLSRARVPTETPLRSAQALDRSRPDIKIQAEWRAEYNWSGLYWGVSAGGAATRSRILSNETTAQTVTAGGITSLNGSQSVGSAEGNKGGGFLDLYGGINWQISNLVVGGQLEATAADLNFSSSGFKRNTYTGSGAGNVGFGDFRPQVAARWMTSGLVRAGYLVDERTLIYGLGGWTGAQFETRNVTDNPFYQPRETFWANGWTAGGGAEYRLNSAWSVRAEYRYTDFGTVTTSDHYLFSQAGPGLSAQTSADRATSYHQSMQSGRIGVAYSFPYLQ